MKLQEVGLSVRDKKRKAQARAIAATSSERQKHGCVITIGGRVMAVGVNARRNEVDTYNVIPAGSRHIHAEIAAMKAMDYKCKGAVLTVARVNAQGEERMSKPCANCYTVMKYSGVKRVVYSIENSEIIN